MRSALLLIFASPRSRKYTFIMYLFWPSLSEPAEVAQRDVRRHERRIHFHVEQLRGVIGRRLAVRIDRKHLRKAFREQLVVVLRHVPAQSSS